jgi:hypothetical protein
VLRIAKFGGLITAVSPYIVPPGGAVEQVNAQSLFPGQLTVRGGMTTISAGGDRSRAANLPPVLEMWGYSPGSGKTEVIFAFTATGEIRQIENPTIEYPEPR